MALYFWEVFLPSYRMYFRYLKKLSSLRFCQIWMCHKHTKQNGISPQEGCLTPLFFISSCLSSIQANCKKLTANLTGLLCICVYLSILQKWSSQQLGTVGTQLLLVLQLGNWVMVKLNGLARSHSGKTVAEPSVNLMVSTLSLSWINWLYFLSLCRSTRTL